MKLIYTSILMVILIFLIFSPYVFRTSPKRFIETEFRGFPEIQAKAIISAENFGKESHECIRYQPIYRIWIMIQKNGIDWKGIELFNSEYFNVEPTGCSDNLYLSVFFDRELGKDYSYQLFISGTLNESLTEKDNIVGYVRKSGVACGDIQGIQKPSSAMDGCLYKDVVTMPAVYNLGEGRI